MSWLGWGCRDRVRGIEVALVDKLEVVISELPKASGLLPADHPPLVLDCKTWRNRW